MSEPDPTTDDASTPGDGAAVARGVVDRIVEGLAVVLVGDDETEFEVPVSSLPGGVVEGSVVVLRTTETPVVVLGVDDAATAAAHDRAADQRERLRGRSRRFGPQT